MKSFLRSLSPFPLIQEGQLSVTGESLHTSTHAQEKFKKVNLPARHDLNSTDWAVKPTQTKKSFITRTQRSHDVYTVALTSKRHDVVSTLSRRCLNIACPLAL